MREALQAHGALSRGTFSVAVLISLAVLFAPGGDVPAAPPGVDKLVHLSLFLVLAVSGRWAGVRPLTLGILLTGYAMASEIVQALTPLERSGSVADWLADVAGVLLGIWLWRTTHRRDARRRSR